MKNTLIRGTIILTLAALVTRVLGVAQRIPLQRILGDEGMATYGIAYNIYGILLIIATVGIPSALSKQIAESHAMGLYREADQMYRAARDFALASGVVAAAFLYGIAPYYAVHVSHDPEAVLSIRAIAPALLLFPLISVMRGYFQGLQFMSPTGMSQISEQILRVSAAVILPLLLLQSGFSQEIAVAGASFGAVAGSIGALLSLVYFFRKTGENRKQEINRQEANHPISRKRIYGKLLKSAIPISLASTAIPLIYFIDSSTVIALLKGDLGHQGAKNMLGILTGRAQALAAIPPILAIALSSAVLPAIASAHSRKDMAEVARTASLSLRLTLVTGTPAALFLTGSAFAVNGFLFGNTEGSWVISTLSLGSIFQIMMMTSLAILQGLGQMTPSMWHVFAGILMKAVLNPILAPWLGIYGVILATSCAFLLILGLNLKTIFQSVPLHIMGERWRGFWFACMAMMAILSTVMVVLDPLLANWHPFLHYGVICLVSGLLGISVYGWILFKNNGVTDEDLQHLPGKARRWVRSAK